MKRVLGILAVLAGMLMLFYLEIGPVSEQFVRKMCRFEIRL